MKSDEIKLQLNQTQQQSDEMYSLRLNTKEQFDEQEGMVRHLHYFLDHYCSEDYHSYESNQLDAIINDLKQHSYLKLEDLEAELQEIKQKDDDLDEECHQLLRAYYQALDAEEDAEKERRKKYDSLF